MTGFINIRGCNGCGKTTLLRSLVKLYPSDQRRVTEIDVSPYVTEKHAPIPFTVLRGAPLGNLAILGDYTPEAAGQTTAGCDRVKTQAAAKAALECAVGLDVDVILFEGVVISTIFGPWQEWSKANGGMVWAFLDTPLAECLRRIQLRNGGKPIKEDQVADKYITLGRVADKARQAGEHVVDLPWESALRELKNTIRGMQS